MTNKIDKFNGLDNTQNLINLLYELEAKTSCYGVKFRDPKAKSTLTYSLTEIFNFVEAKSSQNKAFVTPQLVWALRVIKVRGIEAEQSKVKKWSCKWLIGLLVQLGRAIARFLGHGCKTFNVDAKLTKFTEICKENQRPAEVALEKAERGEKITKVEYQLLQKRTTLDLKTWKDPTKICVENGSTEAFEGISEFLSNCRKLTHVMLPPDNEKLFEWLILDPENNRNDPSRKSTLESHRHIQFVYSMPPLNFVGATSRELDRVLENRNYWELLVVNFPRAKEKTIAANLQMVLQSRLVGYLEDVRRNIEYLFDDKLVLSEHWLSEHWATWLAGLPHGTQKELFDLLLDFPEKIKYLIPIVEATRIHRPPTPSQHFSVDITRSMLYSDHQKSALFGALYANRDNISFIIEVFSLIFNHTSDSKVAIELFDERMDERLFNFFTRKLKFEHFVEHFASSATTPEEKAKRLTQLLGQQHQKYYYPKVYSYEFIDYFHDKRRVATICKTFGVTPLQLVGASRFAKTATLDSCQATYVENIAIDAVLVALGDLQYSTEQHRILVIRRIIQKIPDAYKSECLKKMAILCLPEGITPLMAALIQNCVDEEFIDDKAFNDNLVTGVLTTLIESSALRHHSQKIKNAFDQYWKAFKGLSNTHQAIKEQLKRLKIISMEGLDAFLSSADEAGLLGFVPKVAKIANEATELDETWLKPLLSNSDIGTFYSPSWSVKKQAYIPIVVDASAIARVLANYPQLCLKMSEPLLQEIFPKPEHESIATKLRAKAKAHLPHLYDQLGTLPAEALPNEVRKMVLEYVGYPKAVIDEAEAASRPPVP